MIKIKTFFFVIIYKIKYNYCKIREIKTSFSLRDIL